MKKIFLSLLLIPFLGIATAQSAWDGLQFSQNYYGGTARFTAMGGAFAALGGDFGALSVNPAGIGVFRSWDLMITPTVSYNITDTKYLKGADSDSYTSFGFDNLGLVFDIYNDELLKLNLGIGYNKLNSFIDRISAYGTTSNDDYSYSAAIAMATDGISPDVLADEDAFNKTNNWTGVIAWDTWLIYPIPDYKYYGATEYAVWNNIKNMYEIFPYGPVNQTYYKEQNGHMGEFILSFGGNVADEFYFGMNLGIQNVWRNIYQSITEKAVDPSDFVNGFNTLTHETERETRGAGCNIKLGFIWRPIEGLRWGAYFHSPSWLYLTDKHSEKMTVKFDYPYENTDPYYDRDKTHYSSETGIGSLDYMVTTPLKWGTGLAYVIGNMAIISLEYEGMNYGTTRMSGYNGRRYSKLPYIIENHPKYGYEDDYTKDNFGLVSNFRAGAEVRLAPIALRAGFAHYGSPLKNNKDFASNILSFGLGYNADNFYIDGAYSFALNGDRDYNLYSDSPFMTTNSFFGKIAVTFGFRF